MSSDNFNVNLPLELPKDEYSHDYFVRLINQLRLNFSQFQSPNEIRAVQQSFDWFIS
tara:strand:- start:1891 stop:2061 length:171 start_codon:yes stop_codon:yes gene_type:complete